MSSRPLALWQPSGNGSFGSSSGSGRSKEVHPLEATVPDSGASNGSPCFRRPAGPFDSGFVIGGSSSRATSTPMTIALKLFQPARVTWVMWMTKNKT